VIQSHSHTRPRPNSGVTHASERFRARFFDQLSRTEDAACAEQFLITEGASNCPATRIDDAGTEAVNAGHGHGLPPSRHDPHRAHRRQVSVAYRLARLHGVCSGQPTDAPKLGGGNTRARQSQPNEVPLFQIFSQLTPVCAKQAHVLRYTARKRASN
jgi:hypothetical protein